MCPVRSTGLPEIELKIILSQVGIQILLRRRLRARARRIRRRLSEPKTEFSAVGAVDRLEEGGSPEDEADAIDRLVRELSATCEDDGMRQVLHGLELENCATQFEIPKKRLDQFCAKTEQEHTETAVRKPASSSRVLRRLDEVGDDDALVGLLPAIVRPVSPCHVARRICGGVVSQSALHSPCHSVFKEEKNSGLWSRKSGPMLVRLVVRANTPFRT